MAGAALHFGNINSDIDGMFEGLVLEAGFGHVRRGALGQDPVAGAAVFRKHLSLRALMQAVMAAEATVRIQVPDMIGMRSPIRLHFRKNVLV
jgi:hypothetical protein